MLMSVTFNIYVFRTEEYKRKKFWFAWLTICNTIAVVGTIIVIFKYLGKF